MQKASKYQVRKRKTKRNRLKPVRMAWRIYLKKEVNYDEMGTAFATATKKAGVLWLPARI